MKILLAVDPPGESDTIITEVVTRPWPSNTSMEVLSVVEPSHVPDMRRLYHAQDLHAGVGRPRPRDYFRDDSVAFAGRIHCQENLHIDLVASAYQQCIAHS